MMWIGAANVQFSGTYTTVQSLADAPLSVANGPPRLLDWEPSENRKISSGAPSTLPTYASGGTGPSTLRTTPSTTTTRTASASSPVPATNSVMSASEAPSAQYKDAFVKGERSVNLYSSFLSVGTRRDDSVCRQTSFSGRNPPCTSMPFSTTDEENCSIHASSILSATALH